jgi:ADP-Ribosyltransferase in polyvalent proteins
MRFSEIISEAVDHQFVGSGEVTVYRNPSVQQAVALLKRYKEIRGLEHDGMVLLWNSYDAVHFQIEASYGLRGKDCAEFFVRLFEEPAEVTFLSRKDRRKANPWFARFLHALPNHVLMEDYDPLKVERFKASFIFHDGKFIPVPYQQHLNVLGRLFNQDIPDWRDWGSRAPVYDALQQVAVKHHIVQGEFQPGGQNLKSILTLIGTLKDCRTAYAAFRQRWPELLVQVSVVSLVTLDAHGKKVADQWLEDTKIDRKLGNRTTVQEAALCERIGADINTPAFRRWFGDSKVVDHAGRPLVMYHGTMFTFSEFHQGSHFGDLTAANTRLANLANDDEPWHLGRFRYPQHRGTVMPVYLAIENPLRIIDDGGLSDGQDLAKAALDAGGITREEYLWIVERGSSTIARRRLISKLNHDYDGLVYRNTVEGSADSWVPFNAYQVKSVFNNGAWSNSDNISEATCFKSRTMRGR